jgi:hypothetical protein
MTGIVSDPYSGRLRTPKQPLEKPRIATPAIRFTRKRSGNNPALSSSGSSAWF